MTAGIGTTPIAPSRRHRHGGAGRAGGRADVVGSTDGGAGGGTRSRRGRDGGGHVAQPDVAGGEHRRPRHRPCPSRHQATGDRLVRNERQDRARDRNPCRARDPRRAGRDRNGAGPARHRHRWRRRARGRRDPRLLHRSEHPRHRRHPVAGRRRCRRRRAPRRPPDRLPSAGPAARRRFRRRH